MGEKCANTKLKNSGSFIDNSQKSLAMSKSHFPDLLRLRAVVWMEIGFAFRHFNASRSAIQRLWDQYQSEVSVPRRHVLGRPRVTTGSEECFPVLSVRRSTTVPQFVADPLLASRRRIFATAVRRQLSQSRSLRKINSCVCPPQRTTEEDIGGLTRWSH